MKKHIDGHNKDDKSGTTVIACLITPQHIFMINAGDSRAILVRNNEIEFYTYDHKPNQLKERERIQNAGGLVAMSRVNGGLATSRGLGDFEYKNQNNLSPKHQFVSPIPDVSICSRNSNNEFIVLGCDGVWDVLANEEVKDFIRDELKTKENSLNPEELGKIVEDLVDFSLNKGSRDNISATIVYFGSNKTNPKAIDRPLKREDSNDRNKPNPKSVDKSPKKNLEKDQTSKH
jgi:serine/threonine protein phosphatase PrpC